MARAYSRADEMTRHFLRAASVVLDTSDELASIAYVMGGDTKDAIAALNKACELRLMRGCDRLSGPGVRVDDPGTDPPLRRR